MAVITSGQGGTHDRLTESETSADGQTQSVAYDEVFATSGVTETDFNTSFFTCHWSQPLVKLAFPLSPGASTASSAECPIDVAGHRGTLTDARTVRVVGPQSTVVGGATYDGWRVQQMDAYHFQSTQDPSQKQDVNASQTIDYLSGPGLVGHQTDSGSIAGCSGSGEQTLLSAKPS